MKKLLFISMLGEDDQFDPQDFTKLCPSGLEKDWIADWFAPLSHSYGFELVAIDICRGDPLPDPNTIDCVIVGGTVHTVDEKRSWFDALKIWLLTYRESKKPLLGICGGHQFIATQIEDGILALRPEGRLVGTHPVELTPIGKDHDLMRGLPAAPQFSFANFYHVEPSDNHKGRVLARFGSSAAIAIDHGGNWYSTQFHPESRLETWQTFFAKNDRQNISYYAAQHDGEQLLANFLEIAAKAS